jgi:hypothetical protein
MKNLIWLIALVFAASIFQSCEKENMQEQPEAPAIPPMAMFMMPTDDFDESQVDTSEFTSPDDRSFQYHHWLHAAVNLVFWNTAIHLHMALPTTAFAHAAAQTPEYIGNLTFEWDYIYVAPPELGGGTYYVVLTGQLTPTYEEVIWTMTVSQEGGFSDFVWYTGISSTEEDEGEFTLNRFPNNPQPYLLLEYSGDETTGYGALRFTNVVPGGPDFGNYIEYREEPGNPYDRAFDVQADPGNLMEIQWNEVGVEGRIRHELHFGDNEWYCWDEFYIDTECDE